MNALMPLLILLQFPFSLSKGNKSKSEIWKPYNFKGTEYFKYEVKSVSGEKTQTGFNIIKIQKEGDGYVVYLKGKLGDNENESKIKVKSKDEISGAVMGQTIMNPAFAPLGVALFSPVWTLYFTTFLFGFSWEVGSKWKSENTEVAIPGYETYAGIKGKKLVIKDKGVETYVIVFNNDVALPLYLKMVTKEKGDLYEFKLIEYRE